MADEPQAQPVEGQGQPSSPPAAPPAAPAPVAGDGPWANDLAQMFPDDATRGVVDQFLRTKVQPYTTQLEQKQAALADAERLYNDFQQDPLATYQAITAEMFGPDAAQQLMTQLQQEQQQQQQPDPQQNGQAPQQPPPYDPRVEAAVSYVEQQQNQQFYNQEMQRVAAANADVDPNLLHPFVAAADGNFDAAVEMYRGFASQWQQANQPAAAAPPVEAPPVLGNEGGSSPIPTEKQGQTLGEAINDFMAEQRASAPPVIGTA